MNRVTAEIAQEIGVFLQDQDLHPTARELQTEHHAGRAAADDTATNRQFLLCIFQGPLSAVYVYTSGRFTLHDRIRKSPLAPESAA
ncbi:hypothetical protein GCM10009105_08910 [Dokdonella soli]|uniref:DUF4258 domain-containing protein n=1 Tax=Dokdonella soli TaxID=529810 RepID=A0ABN1IDI3_9GAMM